MRYQFSPIWHHIAKRGLWRLYDNTLPYPVNRRYVRHARRCRASSNTSWPLRNAGPIHLANVLDLASAQRCSAAIAAAIDDGRLSRSQSLPFLVVVPRPLDLFGDGILDVFDGPLGARLRDLYGCEFRIEWLDCYRTYEGARDASWAWHIDNVPPFFVKVLLYLTDSDSQSGTTEFVSAEETRLFKRAGYFGVTADERRADLNDIARRSGFVHRPMSFEMRAGDALLFNNNNLHRGGGVVRGYRDVMSFAILPARQPWRDELRRAVLDAVQTSGGFPINPSQPTR